MNASKRIAREAMPLFRACLVNGALDVERVRGVVQELADARPRGFLETLAVFRRLVELESERHIAKIESAQPLAADVRARLVESLSHTYGAGVSTAFEENPALIGGVRIHVGSDVYDGSVRGRLAALEKSF